MTGEDNAVMASTGWKCLMIYLVRVALWYLVILYVMVMLAPYEGWSDFVLIGMGAVCLHEILCPSGLDLR